MKQHNNKTPSLSLILKKSDANTVKKAAMAEGMTTLRQDCLYKVFKGITSVDEMVRVINEDESESMEQQVIPYGHVQL